MSTYAKYKFLPSAVNKELNQQLYKRVFYGIKAMVRQAWPMSIWQYLKNTAEIIPKYALSEPEAIPDQAKFNVLAELLTFLKNEPDSGIDVRAIKTLESVVKNQAAGKSITKTQRYMIRKYFETLDAGVKVFNKFINYVIGKRVLAPEAELLLNPYTSILNLNEIYVNVNTKYTLSYTFNNKTYDNITIYTVGSKILLHPDTTTKVSLSHPKGVYDNLRLVGINDKDQRDLLTPEYLHELVARVCLFPHLLKSSAMPERISLYLVDFRKEFITVGSKKEIIYTSSEINTGVTDGKYIAITRKEEALKTILHELIHFYNMDFRKMNPEFEAKLTQLLAINNKLDSLNIFEAHTETMASIINILCWMYFNNKSEPAGKINTKKDLTPILAKHVFYQVCYSIYKCAHILNAGGCNINSVEAGTTAAGTKLYEACQITQTTNVASYYIIKLFFYIALDELANKCLSSTTGKFIEGKTQLDCVETIILRGLDNKLLATILNNLMTHRSAKQLINNKSARMTCHG